MKQLIWIMTTVLCTSCSAYKKNTSELESDGNAHPPYRSEFYFDNCDDVKAFLMSIIVNKNSDKNLKPGYFKISSINAAYVNAKDIIPVGCFKNMPVAELESIFGMGSNDGESTFWYFLDYKYEGPMSIEVRHKNGFVEKLIVHQQSVTVGSGK